MKVCPRKEAGQTEGVGQCPVVWCCFYYCFVVVVCLVHEQVMHDNGFPVPRPIDNNRHCVVMELKDGYPL